MSRLHANAVKSSWRHTPMPQSQILQNFECQLDQVQYESLSFGLVPTDMDDKWFIFMEDNQVFFHRSWTGHCIFSIKFEEKAGTMIAVEAMVNSCQDQYKPINDEVEIRLLRELMSKVIVSKVNSTKTQEKACIELGGVVGAGKVPTLTELGFSK